MEIGGDEANVSSRLRRDPEMPAPDRPHAASRTDSPPPRSVAEKIDGAGVYLTNEVFLYRVVRFVASAVGEMVELEDCFGLDVVRVPLAELHSRRLRVVTPACAYT
jgi:hypothetical protein